MSNLTNSVSTAGHGDMTYALAQASQALGGFAYSNAVSFVGATPADMGAMQHGARQWLEEKAFQDQKSDALTTIRSRLMVGRNTEVQTLLAQIERSETPAQLQVAMDAIERVIASAERLYGEQHDPEVETTTQRIEQMWARSDELTRNINEVLDKVETEEERDRKNTALERQRAARPAYIEAIQSGDPARIAAARAELTAADNGVTQADIARVDGAMSRGQLTPEVANEVRREINQRDEFFTASRNIAREHGRDENDRSVQQSQAQQSALESSAQRESAVNDEALAGFAMLRRRPQATQAAAETSIGNGTLGDISLPTLEGVVLADAAAPANQLAGMTRPTQDVPGATR